MNVKEANEALSQRDALKAQAEEQLAEYPQYAGHWDGYLLGRVTERVRTKMGVAFEAGDLALIRPVYYTFGFRTAYSWRNRIDTSIPAQSVEMILGDPRPTPGGAF